MSLCRQVVKEWSCEKIFIPYGPGASVTVDERQARYMAIPRSPEVTEQLVIRTWNGPEGDVTLPDGLRSGFHP